LIVTTAYWSDKRPYQITSQESEEFSKWFLLANAKGRYSRGSTETLLDQDLAVIRDGGEIANLLQRLTQQVGRLDFTSEELVGRTSRSGAFKTLFLAFRQDNARDWATSLEISPKHSGKSDAIEHHHIFPKAYLKKQRTDIDRYAIDDIANLAFVGSKTNKMIGDKAPSVYRKDFEAPDLADQLIVFTEGLDTADAFERFVAKRRAAIALKLNQFLGVG
jgi:hypothetical protein